MHCASELCSARADPRFSWTEYLTVGSGEVTVLVVYSVCEQANDFVSILSNLCVTVEFC